MSWWIWILAGLALLGLELASGSFFMVFLGIAAIVVGLLDLLFGMSPVLEWLLFTGLSAGLVLLVRKPLLGKFHIKNDPRDIDKMVGLAAVATEAIPPGGNGRVEMRGTVWTAHNDGAEPLAAGDRCRVDRMDGLSL
ncbi:MAG TPA: hypothetical protein DD490_09400, partial [Acidobacteria bacterium]|nr:hypothetical protein [Acidobacteriota bacterium]